MDKSPYNYEELPPVYFDVVVVSGSSKCSYFGGGFAEVVDLNGYVVIIYVDRSFARLSVRCPDLCRGFLFLGFRSCDPVNISPNHVPVRGSVEGGYVVFVLFPQVDHQRSH